MSEITKFLSAWYNKPNIQNSKQIIANLEQMWEEFKPYSDSNFLTDLTSNEENKFQKRYWEMFLGSHLLRQGLKLSHPSKAGGPDFKIEYNGHVLWIEATTPGPSEKNNQVPEISSIHSTAKKVPSNEILLRYTGAIDTKFKKYKEYLNKNIVKPNEIFIIAINYYKYSPLYFQGISTYPAIFEAVYPIGPQQINKDSSHGLTLRDKIFNVNGKPIDTNLFLNPQYSGITAILFANQSEYPPKSEIILVHNKLAANPLHPSPLKVDCEYWLENISNEEYRICQSLNTKLSTS